MTHYRRFNRPGKLASAFRHGALLVALTTGCGIKSGVVDTVTPSEGRDHDASHWAQSKVLFRAFEHQGVVATSTAVASGPGGTATAHGETVGKSESVPIWILHEAQQSFPFEAITNLAGVGAPPEYILEGSLGYAWRTPWWTWVQLVDLWVHAWFIPTLGRHLILEFRLNLYDNNHRMLRSWKAERKVKYMSDIWWAIGHGGSGGSGFEKEYRAYLHDIFEQIGNDMREQIRATPPNLAATDRPTRMETERTGVDATAPETDTTHDLDRPSAPSASAVTN